MAPKDVRESVCRGGRPTDLTQYERACPGSE